MIKKISKLSKIGCFLSFTQKKDFQYGDNNCNIIFGFNGSGKTTISNALSFFADNSFIDEDEKKEIFDDIKNSNDSIVELDLQNTSTIKYPANSEHNKEIYIFNSHFVSTHVFNGTKGKIKKFSNVSGEIKNKEIDRINEEISTVEKERKNLKDSNKELDNKHKEITRRRSKDFSKSLTDKNKSIQTQNLSLTVLPTKTLYELEKELADLVIDYELSKKQDGLKDDLETLRQLDFSKKIALDLTKNDELLSKNIQQLSKDVLEKKIKDVQKLFEDEKYKQSAEKWFKYGKDVLKEIDKQSTKICPICDTDITDKFKTLLVDYDGYFDESYNNFITELNSKIGKLKTDIELLEKYELDVGTLETIFNKYTKLLSELVFEKYDFSQIKTDLETLKTNLESKNNNIQKTFSKPADIENNIESLNIAITNFQTLRSSIISVLESKTLNTNQIEDKIRGTYKDIIILEFNQTDKNGVLSVYKENKEKISKIEKTTLPVLKNKLSEELKKIKAESKSISKYLAKMGITHFDIDINEDQEDENIIIKYKNSSNDKNKLENSLSDGEKTALAFAYFLSKFENEVNTKAKLKKSVVVIDDPISSLDQNRLYSTAYLIYKNFEDVKQLIVLSHNFLFLKYFNSLSVKPECFFLDQNIITELPEELRNFETPYFYMLKGLIDFNNGETNYNKVKKYLPNYIRRILETFLSFKFSRVVDRKGGYRSPGLNEFDKNIEQTDFDEKIKKEISEKIAKIISIGDAHPQGNAHKKEENFYISENDLKILAKNTIDIIETMDKLHKTSFVNNQE